MACCDEVDVFGACILKFTAYFHKIFHAYGLTHALLGYLIILAEGTMQCTTCEKDCATATVYCYEGFFSEMQAC